MNKRLSLWFVLVLLNVFTCDDVYGNQSLELDYKCAVNSSTWNTTIFLKLKSLQNVHGIPLRKLQSEIIGTILEKCPNLSTNNLNRILKGVFCMFFRYNYIDQTIFVDEISLNTAKHITNILKNESENDDTLAPTNECMSFYNNPNLGLFNFLSVDEMQLNRKIFNLINEKQNTKLEFNDLLLFITYNISKLIDNIPETVRQNIFDITYDTLKFNDFSGDSQRINIASKLAREITEFIENSKTKINFSDANCTLLQYHCSSLETSKHKSDVYQLYANIFESFEFNNFPSIIHVIATMNEVVETTLQRKIYQYFEDNIETLIYKTIQPRYVQNSTQHAFYALHITKQVTNITNIYTNYQEIEINDIREFSFVKLRSYEVEYVKNFILKFITVTNKISFENCEKKLSESIHDILNEHKEDKKIELNFTVILNKIYEATNSIILREKCISTDHDSAIRL